MSSKRLILILILVIQISCKPTKIISNSNIVSDVDLKKRNIQKYLRSWQHKDIILDTIPGVSLEKAYKELIKNQKGENVIVAVMDTGMDIDHPELKNQIWINKNEIPDNNIDDDKNGYIDDVYGWNFLGNSKGENIVYENLEFIKVIKKFNAIYKNRKEEEILSKEKRNYEIYKASLVAHDKNKKLLKEDYEYIDNFVNNQKNAHEALTNFLGINTYTYEQISKIDTKGDKDLARHIENRRFAMYYDMNEDWIDYFKRDIEIREKYKLNLNYDSGKNSKIPSKKGYGNNDVRGNLKIESHGTNVAGIIAAKRGNDRGLDGITDNVQIMPIRVVPQGDEHDIDVANGIRYAVDNGAKVINMSFGKEFSLNQKVVAESIKYAAKKDVIIVCAAGNDSYSVDKNNYYPNDTIDSLEISNTFLKVGASSPYTDNRLLAYFSNYGKVNVDVFAPGEDIYTTSPNNKYESDGGTSFSAPIVSGIAAIIRSLYPKLSASQVKEILINSGTYYQVNIEIEQEGESKKTIPFSELSKSGRIVNAYNALLLAQKINNSK